MTPRSIPTRSSSINRIPARRLLDVVFEYGRSAVHSKLTHLLLASFIHPSVAMSRAWLSSLLNRPRRRIWARRIWLGLSFSTSSSAMSIRRPYSVTPSPRRTSPIAVRMMPDAFARRRCPRASSRTTVRSCCFASPATLAPAARAFSMAAANSFAASSNS